MEAEECVSVNAIETKLTNKQVPAKKLTPMHGPVFMIALPYAATNCLLDRKKCLMQTENVQLIEVNKLVVGAPQSSLLFERVEQFTPVPRQKWQEAQ